MINRLSHTSSLWAVFVFFTITTFLFTPILLQAEPRDPTIARLFSFIERLQTIEAEFTQQVEEADGSMPKLSRGRFSAKRPGLFRWDYREPFEQMILSDGESVYYYEVDLAQVTKTRADLLEETPAAFFVSDRPLDQTFTLSVTEDATWKLPSVRMVPLTQGTIQEITLTLHPQKDEILNLVVLDSLGNHSRFTFLKIRYNQPLPSDRFTFSLPEGVDLIDESDNNTP
ncbi:MAG: outer membrane lipoprotein chaperone LolA [Magnetococcales bacterium]|nr:outer membrane lipoprotein chaperone LolA [Magnetococcales bacterium]